MSASQPTTADADTVDAAAVLRRLGRFSLLRLIGKSRRSMAWRVRDPRSDRERILVLPRQQPAHDAALQRWKRAVERGARLEHPNLAKAVEIGLSDHWPYVLYEPAGQLTIGEATQQPQALSGIDAAALLTELLQGLAYAHEGAVAHHDVQPFLLLSGDSQPARLMGLEVGGHIDADKAAGAPMAPLTGLEALALQSQRLAARSDVLAVGLLLHRLLAGQPALDEADIGVAIERLPPHGRELVRLPWNTPLQVPEVLRAIVNRSTDRQPRRRYASARSLLQALDGWRVSDSALGGGPLALLLDRLHSVGSLPASPGSAERAARLTMMERHRTDELAEVVMQDLALTFELLRWVNGVQVRGTQAVGSAPVLTVRRAIAMVGLDGVRRAALGLRGWPGPLDEPAATALRALFDSVKHAGRLARELRPAGYDAEVVSLLAMLQNLGRLITSYHFPNEVLQIHRLMRPVPGGTAGQPEEPGMTEQAAAFAVLGTDIESIGHAVARHWGLDETVLHLIRRLPATVTPRVADNDDDVLRAVASCANELGDSLSLPADRRAAATRHIAQRYARALGITYRDVQDILAGSRAAVGSASKEATRGEVRRGELSGAAS